MESERSTPSSYTLQPTRFCNEDILFCTDIDLESQVEMKVSGPKGRPITRLESIKQTILLFVHAKLAINPDHRFSFATLGQSASWNQKEFSNEIESAIAAVRGLGQLAHSSYGHVDLTQLFRLAAHEAKKSRLQNRILRVILIYCRSSVQPQYQWTTNQKLFTLDVIYLHDKPGPENCPQKVYDALVDALERVSEYEGYIYESGQGLSRVLFKLTCLLLSHPQQRCVQDDIDFPKSLAKKSPAPESTPGEENIPGSASDFKEFTTKTIMGVCISIPSSMIQKAKAEAAGHENVLLIQDPVNSSQGLPGHGSVHSQQGDKGTNQDSAILHQGYGTAEGAFCGVFDGHGVNGHKVSKLVRNHLSPLLLGQRSAFALEDGEELVTNNVFDEWKRACVSAFKIMDRELKLQHNLDCTCSGSTAVTIIKQGEDLVIANLGDSRAVLGTITQTDELKAVQLTVDLKPDLPSEAERIRRCNGRVFAHEDEPDVQRVWSPGNDFMSLAMARAFGDFHFKKYGVISIPQISYRRLTSRDQFLVLATDGVWDVLSNEEVASIVWSVESEEEASKAVVEAAVAEWGHKFPSIKVDDCTVVCLFLQERKQENHLTNKDILTSTAQLT